MNIGQFKGIEEDRTGVIILCWGVRVQHMHKYTYSRDLDLNLMPCSSASSALREHIKRAYLQANLWITATTRDRLILESKESYGWSFSETILVPTLLPEELLTRPSNLPEPCKCGVCRFETRCKCRIHKLKCCRYCVCSKDNTV